LGGHVGGSFYMEKEYYTESSEDTEGTEREPRRNEIEKGTDF
jgi:hypothetical protein